MFKMINKIIQYPRLTQEYPAQPVDLGPILGSPELDPLKCNRCGVCASHCPTGAIVLNETVGISYDECLFCALCEDICPLGAVTMTNQFELAKRDRNLLRSEALVIEERDVRAVCPEVVENDLRKKISQLYGRSLHIREVDAGSCNACDSEINALNNPFNDVERLGINFVASPRHADMLLVTGAATRNMEAALLKTYEATPVPKLVVAVGACACSGGIFKDSYATRNGIDSIIPVDVYIPGCPPRPQAIIYGILKAIDKVR